MVSLKSFLHHVSRKSDMIISEEDAQQIVRLVSDFGGRDNILHVDACITRLRVKVNDLTKVDTAAIQQEGALGVIILGNEVHAIFGKQSDNLRQLLEVHFGNK